MLASLFKRKTKKRENASTVEAILEKTASDKLFSSIKNSEFAMFFPMESVRKGFLCRRCDKGVWRKIKGGCQTMEHS